MKIREICEEFKDAVRLSKDEYYEIFKNPSSREVNEAKSKDLGVRFIIDFNDKIFYVFNENLLHSVASKKLGVKYNYPNWDNMDFAFGVGFIFKGIIKTGLDSMDTNADRKLELKKGEHDWVREYLSFIGPRIR